jgi:hypothetical protein
MPQYTPPTNGVVNFELQSYTPPTNGGVNFSMEDYVPPAGSAIITLTGQNLFSMTPNSNQGSLVYITPIA